MLCDDGRESVSFSDSFDCTLGPSGPSVSVCRNPSVARVKAPGDKGEQRNAPPTQQQSCNQGDDLILAATLMMSNPPSLPPSLRARHYRQASSQTACGRKRRDCTKAYLVTVVLGIGFFYVCHQRWVFPSLICLPWAHLTSSLCADKKQMTGHEGNQKAAQQRSRNWVCSPLAHNNKHKASLFVPGERFLRLQAGCVCVCHCLEKCRSVQGLTSRAASFLLYVLLTYGSSELMVINGHHAQAETSRDFTSVGLKWDFHNNTQKKVNVLVCHNSLLVTIGVDQIHNYDLLSGVTEKLFLRC